MAGTGSNDAKGEGLVPGEGIGALDHGQVAIVEPDGKVFGRGLTAIAHIGREGRVQQQVISLLHLGD